MRIRLGDRARFSPLIRGFMRRMFERKARRVEDLSGAIDTISQSIRLTDPKDTASVVRLEKLIDRQCEDFDPKSFSPLTLHPEVEDGKISKAVVLKPRGDKGEKGIIFISFEYQWAKLLSLKNLEEFARDYTVVVSPTWSPPHCAINYIFPRMFPDPVYCLISNIDDMAHFPRISDRYRMVELFASSWVKPEIYQPKPRSERKIDILMLANFGIYKRHHVLFRALADIPKDIKVVLVGQPNGDRTREVLLREAAAFGVEDRFELRQQLTEQGVLDTLCDAKVSVILSRREGSCVAVVESIFADTPVALSNQAQIGSAVFINDQTGRKVSEDNLAAELTEMVRASESFKAREWALENEVSAYGSTKKMNTVLKTGAEQDGQPWTQDIADHHWRPNPELVHPDNCPWEQREVDYIKEKYGLTIGS